MYHSAIAVTLCPGLVEVIKFGGKVEMEDLYSGAFETVAETNIITFSKLNIPNYVNMDLHSSYSISIIYYDCTGVY